MNSEPKVAIIVVNWNKKEYVLNLLKALEEIDYKHHETIVVDNASTDGSASAIKNEFPGLKVIENAENLGGTGGFNTGMNYALSKGGFKYIWLLDNDALVENNTLSELVKLMEKDDLVGIAGSMIMETYDDLIVELGASVAWSIGTWRPNLRNNRVSNLKTTDSIEVDYVAACSALARTDVLRAVGVMDERFFIHWDDIDLSLRIRKAGYKVKATAKSKVYHGIENKPLNPLFSYYDARNGFLTISKHQSGFSRFFYIFNVLRGTAKGITYGFLTGFGSFDKFTLMGLLDFIKGKFYKTNLSSNLDSPLKNERRYSLKELNLTDETRILIFFNGYTSDIEHVVGMMKSEANCYVSLLVQSDRKELFKELPIDSYMTFESYRQSTFQTISLLNKILASKHDVCISPSLSVIPFSHAATKYYLYDPKKVGFVKSRENILSFWKLLVAFLGGELLALLFTPIVFIASFRHDHVQANLEGNKKFQARLSS